MQSARYLLVTAVLLAGVACGEGSPVVPVIPVDSLPKPELPITGVHVPGMASFDQAIPQLMAQWGIPGAAVAVARDGRLVFARGYGWADLAAEEPVQPESLFRIASISKPITAAAVLSLVEAGALRLDDRPFQLRSDLEPPPGGVVDSRIYDVTVRQLLYHSGGWDRSVSFDPMFRPAVAAQAVGAPAPASAETVMRYMMGQPLDFEPGTRYAYSNFGYSVLGRVIEGITGETYEAYTRRAILEPAGITRMRIGATRLEDRAEGEVRYYELGSATSVFPGGGTVPVAYGGFYLEAMDSHGGWIASPIDLLRFATAVDGSPTRPDVLAPATITLMTSRPPAPLWQGTQHYYAMGWLVRPAEGNWWHDGLLPGGATLLVRTGGGITWAALLNSRSSPTSGASVLGALDTALWQAIGGVAAWPAHDLFPDYP
jgi:N-acyl-D-amino-acid deacylase